MSRFERPPFSRAALEGLQAEEHNQLLFDWWCDDAAPLSHHLSDRVCFIRSLEGKATPFWSRALREDDPAPLLTTPSPQGFQKAYLLSAANDLREAFTDPTKFSNVPYAEFGGGAFLLGLDPGQAPDWHARQSAFIKAALAPYEDKPMLASLARLAIDQAALTSLATPRFDLVRFAEQASLRYGAQLFGYAFQDYELLQDASRATYRALQYIAIGRHFTTEPLTLSIARQAFGRLVERTSELIDEYARLKRSPRKIYSPRRKKTGVTDDWPTGVQPWSEVQLSSLGEPLLRRISSISNEGGAGSALSGRDRSIIAATLLAGTLGNVQSSICLLVQAALTGPSALQKDARTGALNSAFVELVETYLATVVPVPVLPRRAVVELNMTGGVTIPAGSDCLLLLEGTSGCPHPSRLRIWGEAESTTAHPCLGRRLSTPLIAAMVHYTLRLPGLDHCLDPLTGEPLNLERSWGFGCTRYPLRYERDGRRVQSNLIVSMRVKTPVNDHASALRSIIAAAAPRIEFLLRSFGSVHFAWFEFTDGDHDLTLRTIYDGEFEAYVQNFALRGGDLFDALFQHLEDAPPSPVAEHPQDFVQTLLRLNRAPLGGYLYSAYPMIKATAFATAERVTGTAVEAAAKAAKAAKSIVR